MKEKINKNIVNQKLDITFEQQILDLCIKIIKN